MAGLRSIAAAPQGSVHRTSRGFSLLEMTIGLALASTITLALVWAVRSMVSSSTTEQQELNRKDEVNRVLNLIRQEAATASRVETGSGLSESSCAGWTGSNAPLLILKGSPGSNQDVAYGIRPRPDTTWKGPNVLVRCGPYYNTDGSFKSDITPIRNEQVIMDSLCDTSSPCPASGGFNVSATAITGSTGSQSLNRNLQISLVSHQPTQTGGRGRALANSVQVNINRNEIYGLLSTSNTCSSLTGCADPTEPITYYVPSPGASIAGSTALEDVIYFNRIRNDYGTLTGANGSGTCTRSSCGVQPPAATCIDPTTGNTLTTALCRIQITNGDVLVFLDQELRIPF